MIRVMLVDDEPFTLEGLSVLLNWQDYDCQIVKKAANGKDAYDYLKDNKVDLVFADIKMPVMTGIELLQSVREEGISDAFFVIISGYNDFCYAREAMRYSALDYLLKPVSTEGIVQVIEKVKNNLVDTASSSEAEVNMKSVYFTQYLMLLLSGKQKDKHISYLKDNFNDFGYGDFRFIHVCLNDIKSLEEKSDEEIFKIKTALKDRLKTVLGDNKDRIIGDIPGYTDEYELSFIFSDSLIKEPGGTIISFLNRVLSELSSDYKEDEIVFLVGKRVDDLSRISLSYSSASLLRSYRSFKSQKSIYIYEDDIQITEPNIFLFKKELDGLISGIELSDETAIEKEADNLFSKINNVKRGILNDNALMINTNYMLFRLLHIAVELDQSVNQEEIMLYISDNALIKGVDRGSLVHLKQFAKEYAHYLTSLRKNASRGIFFEIEKELEENYAENITLKDLASKYYVNSSYLGQLFKKRYGVSFKDYLGSIRINKAARLLLSTDKKVAQIAEEVGYHDADYFINRFISVKGCTPAKYRKNELGTNS